MFCSEDEGFIKSAVSAREKKTDKTAGCLDQGFYHIHGQESNSPTAGGKVPKSLENCHKNISHQIHTKGHKVETTEGKQSTQPKKNDHCSNFP